uniref:Ig-like domain-containing protein n=1 Tax=Denticeps clupeoides TaxID=299321 RepID=A0AAY4DCZ7_9TELE
MHINAATRFCAHGLYCISDISSDTRVHQGQRTVSSLLGGSVTLPFSFEEEVNKSKLDAETSDKNSCTVQVQQHYLLDPASEGHNVTLNCTVVCGGCAGEHSVYWFRHGTPGSHPGIIYTHGDRSAGCEKNPEAGSSTQSCVYHLPKRNLSTTDAGTYHCAVAACGQITIGNGTKLEISSSNGSGVTALIVTVIISVTANIALVLLWRKALRAGLHFILFLDDLLQMFSHFTKEKQIISRICDEQTCWVFTFLHFIYIF